MADDSLRNRLAAFVPRMVWNLLDRDAEGFRTQGCALFADVAGFTPLTENLAKIGKEGAEELTRILNDFFSAMVGVVHEEGGDVLRFGGDAMTVFFPAGTSASLRAALRMQEEALRFGTIETRGGAFALGVKIGISSGPLLLGTVGDSQVGRDYFAAGRCLDLAADAEHHAIRGQIALCPACAQKLPKGASGVEILMDGFALIADPALAWGLAPEGQKSKDGRTRWPPLPDAAVLEAFLPTFISDKARASQGLLQAEHRRTTVLFLAFSGLDYEDDPEVVEKVRALYRQIALVSAQHGGWVNKLDMGDKGSKAIVLFGAPQALEHQEERACRAALALLADPALRSALTDLRIGITASSLFAAYVGCSERREYTVMGDGINMAARLMANAHPWRVLASRAVMERAGKALTFRELDPIFVKGKAEKVAIFRPEGEREEEKDEQRRFVGREDLLGEAVPGLVDPTIPASLVLWGDAGVGKTALMHRVGRALDEAGVRRIMVPLVAHSVHSYLAAWRPVLFAALGVSRAAPAHIREGALRLAVAGEDEAYLPLFGPLLGLDLSETEASGALGAKERKDVLFAMLVRLFLRQVETGPYGIFLDQIEHADPASLELLQSLVSEAGDRPLKLVVAARSQAAGEATEAFGEALGGFKSFTVLPFTAAETRDYLIHVGGMTPPTDTFLEFLQRKTGGNPKFLEQILDAMRKAGLVAPGPSGLLEVDEDRLASTAFPDTLEGLLLSRVDGLPENERALLKAASVLGPSFSLNLLQTLTEHPQDQIVQAIRSLEGKGVVRMDTWGARPYATFADPLLRDALYESINFSVKRAYHARVAELLEHQGANDPRLWPPLARHFEAAGEGRKACHYLWNAAEDARARYDNTSAFDFLGRYVALCEKSGANPADDVQFRKGLLYLAEASKELGRLEETDSFCQRILAASGVPCAESVAALIKMADNKRRRGDPQGALEVYEKAANMAELLDDKVQQMNIVSDSGVPLAMMGRFDEAMTKFNEADKLARRFKDGRVIVLASMNRGLCFQYGGGNLDEARSSLRTARKVAKERNLRPNLVTISVNEAQLLFDMGDYRRALSVIKEGLEIAKQFGYRQSYVSMFSNQALYQCTLGLWEKARESGESALNLANHYAMIYSCGFNRHTLGMLAGQTGDLERCIAFQSASIRDLVEANNYESARAALSEILMAVNQWRIPDLIRNLIEEYPALLEGLDEHSGNVHALVLRTQIAAHGLLGDTTAESVAEEELRGCLRSAVNLDALGPQAEIGEALVSILSLLERHEEAREAGEALLSTLGHHYYPLKMPPFLLALASAQERASRWEALKPLIRALRRYEKTLDRGLTGLRYHALLSRAALRAGRKKEAQVRRERAVQIANAVLALQKTPPFRDAFLALPEVRDLLGP